MIYRHLKSNLHLHKKKSKLQVERDGNRREINHNKYDIWMMWQEKRDRKS